MPKAGKKVLFKAPKPHVVADVVCQMVCNHIFGPQVAHQGVMRVADMRIPCAKFPCM
jgi:hypothetical protein